MYIPSKHTLNGKTSFCPHIFSHKVLEKNNSTHINSNLCNNSSPSTVLVSYYNSQDNPENFLFVISYFSKPYFNFSASCSNINSTSWHQTKNHYWVLTLTKAPTKEAKNRQNSPWRVSREPYLISHLS